MSFMERQITNKRKWLKCESPANGVEYFDAADFTEEQLRDWYGDDPRLVFETVEGYGARLSAPGYLDCTEWTVFDSVKEAEDYLDEYYPENEDEDED